MGFGVIPKNSERWSWRDVRWQTVPKAASGASEVFDILALYKSDDDDDDDYYYYYYYKRTITDSGQPSTSDH